MSKIYASEVVRIALGEVGYHEKASNKDLDSATANPGSGQWTKYARDLWQANPHYYQSNKNGLADWCAIFVDWCVYMASGQDSVAAQAAMCYTGPYGASCALSVNYYKAVGRFFSGPNAAPKPGDQIFFGSASNIRHTGLVEKVVDGVVYTVEGNSGNQVRHKSYADTNPDIYGYGRPKYDEEPKKQESTEFVDVPRSKWYAKDVEWAARSGIMVGVGDNKFEPDRNITRAEVAAVSHRLYNLIVGGGGNA